MKAITILVKYSLMCLDRMAAAAALPVYPLAKTKPNAVFSFGRFQPPTTGHALLIDQVIAKAAERNADAIVFVSSTENKPSYRTSKKAMEMLAAGEFESTKENENPIPVATKVDILTKQHAGKPVQFVNTTLCGCKSIMQIIPMLKGNGYDSLTMMVGSDRVVTFQEVFDKYFPGTQVLGIERVAAAANARAMSGTKLRTAAVKGDLASFTPNVVMGSYTGAEAKELLNMIRTSLGYAILEGGRRRRKTHRSKRHLRRKTRRFH
jgi:hypothetical protein